MFNEYFIVKLYENKLYGPTTPETKDVVILHYYFSLIISLFILWLLPQRGAALKIPQLIYPENIFADFTFSRAKHYDTDAANIVIGNVLV